MRETRKAVCALLNTLGHPPTRPRLCGPAQTPGGRPATVVASAGPSGGRRRELMKGRRRVAAHGLALALGLASVAAGQSGPWDATQTTRPLGWATVFAAPPLR